MTGKISDLTQVTDIDDIIIRPMSADDLPGLEWNGEYTHFRNVYKAVYKRITHGTAEAWVAESPLHGIVGQVFLQLESDRAELADGWNRAYLYSFRIKPAYRNRGLGTKMMEILENYLISRHFNRLTLNVARDNLDAIRLYKRLGFQIVAEEPGVWSYIDHKGKWQTVEEPSWRMEKQIKPLRY
ncbi:MAG TPA: GNAT family N-acetyltransferase [Anaerolineaceae bacterium]|nr:GNAT family N-acetyltransferase [Anaerolineaceae bacterium]